MKGEPETPEPATTKIFQRPGTFEDENYTFLVASDGRVLVGSYTTQQWVVLKDPEGPGWLIVSGTFDVENPAQYFIQEWGAQTSNNPVRPSGSGEIQLNGSVVVDDEEITLVDGQFDISITEYQP